MIMTSALTGVSGDVSVSGVIEVTEVGVDITVGVMLGETGIVTRASTSVRGKVTVIINGEIGGATVTGIDGTGTAGVIGVGVEETVDVMMGAMGVIVGMGAVGPTSDWVTAMGSAKVVVSEGLSVLVTAIAVPALVNVDGNAGVKVIMMRELSCFLWLGDRC